MTDSDTRFMALALSLGRRGQGRCWPNPAVGCVVVQEGRIVGRGWTQPGGRPHAETMALAQAGDLARGATAYVTLEPCSHHGKTPPCTDALIAAGVARVVASIEDSDARVAGQGFARLREHGIDLTTGVLADEAARDHAGFFLRTEQGRPLVTLKLASSFDGRIATETGQSQWITGPMARRAVHGMRARHDAVMVGAGTARADDPSLTVRDLGIAQQPVRVVVSRYLDLPFMGKLARTAGEVPLWICHGEGADAERFAGLDRIGRAFAALRRARDAARSERDTASVGRCRADTGVLRRGQRVGGVVASRRSGGRTGLGSPQGLAIGADGLPAIGGLGITHLASAPRFELIETGRVGPDILHRWRRAI